ncbi:MAG: phosphatase PAP2 family protein [Phycisphaerae bacterium]|nr:phosphatase PAP2 family protein [Phycisphaerae bacterium]
MTTPARHPATGPRRAVVIVAAIAAGFVVVSLLDRAIFFALRVTSEPGSRALEARDWFQLFRQVGYVPTWILIALSIMLFDGASARRRLRTGGARTPIFEVCRRGLALLGGAVLAGAAAELLKLVIGRERPIGPDKEYQGYVFRPLLDGFRDGSNLGLPSSHAAVAFGAAFVLMRLFPGVWPAALVAASGCALTRLLAGAHFASDVYLAAAVAYACSLLAGRVARPAP